MQKFILIILTLGLLISCSSEPEVTVEPKPVDTATVITEQINTTVDPDSELVITDERFLQIINDFPKYWVQVDIKPNKKIYTTYCDAATPSLKIDKVEEHYEITTTYGQDAEIWNLVNMTANYNTFNEQELQEGIFVAQKISYPDEEFYEVSYFWNKTKGFCTFGDFFSAGSKFAEHSKMNEFEVVKEKCE